MKEETWVIHINDGFQTEVQAVNVEGAIMAAFAKYWEENPNAGALSFDIAVFNKTTWQQVMKQPKQEAQKEEGNK